MQLLFTRLGTAFTHRTCFDENTGVLNCSFFLLTYFPKMAGWTASGWIAIIGGWRAMEVSFTGSAIADFIQLFVGIHELTNTLAFLFFLRLTAFLFSAKGMSSSKGKSMGGKECRSAREQLRRLWWNQTGGFLFFNQARIKHMFVSTDHCTQSSPDRCHHLA